MADYHMKMGTGKYKLTGFDVVLKKRPYYMNKIIEKIISLIPLLSSILIVGVLDRLATDGEVQNSRI